MVNNIAARSRTDLEIPQMETIWLEVRANISKFLLCVAYRPPAYSEFWSHLQNSITPADTRNILLIGNFSADLNSP